MRYLFPLSPYNQQRQFQKKVWVYPVHLAMYATYLRNQGHEVIWNAKTNGGIYVEFLDWGKASTLVDRDTDIKIPFIDLPFPDRVFTDAKNKRWQSYGNYKFHPATHMMVSNLCWYGKCEFCEDHRKLEMGVERGIRLVSLVMEEIDDLIANGYSEVFDDSGTFPVGDWLENFCSRMMFGKRSEKIKIGCNMRALPDIDYKMMKEAGFRMILVGVESASQDTLDRINKGIKIADVVPTFKKMSDAGLEPHITVMFGFQWETEKDAQATLDLVHMLLEKGYAKTAQASVYSPPRTEPDLNSYGHKYVRKIYDVWKRPRFILNQLKSLRTGADVMYAVKAVRSALS